MTKGYWFDSIVIVLIYKQIFEVKMIKICKAVKNFSWFVKFLFFCDDQIKNWLKHPPETMIWFL